MVEMSDAAVEIEMYTGEALTTPRLSGDTRRRLGKALRAVYATTCDTLPIPDAQVDLLLRLRHRERELRRAG